MLLTHKERKDRGPDRERDKRWWEDVYATGDDVIFRKTLLMKRETFNFILGEINQEVVEEPTNMKPRPTTPECQLALTLYRLAHGCTLTTLEDLFGESVTNCGNIFNHVCRVLVAVLYDWYVRLPETDAEWETELRGFLENYEFPCVGAWDGFHVYITPYSMTNLGLVGFNKLFLYAAVGAPGCTHDARMLRYSPL